MVAGVRVVVMGSACVVLISAGMIALGVLWDGMVRTAPCGALRIPHVAGGVAVKLVRVRVCALVTLQGMIVPCVVLDGMVRSAVCTASRTRRARVRACALRTGSVSAVAISRGQTVGHVWLAGSVTGVRSGAMRTRRAVAVVFAVRRVSVGAWDGLLGRTAVSARRRILGKTAADIVMLARVAAAAVRALPLVCACVSTRTWMRRLGVTGVKLDGTGRTVVAIALRTPRAAGVGCAVVVVCVTARVILVGRIVRCAVVTGTAVLAVRTVWVT